MTATMGARSGEDRRVVVTGLGLATSLGLDVETVWRAVLDGRSGVSRIRQFPSDAFPVSAGSEVDLAALLERLGPVPAQVAASRTLAFACWAGDRAWADAGLAGAALDARRAAVCVGAGLFPAMEDRLFGLSPAVLDDPEASLARLLALYRRRPELAAQQDLGRVSALLAGRFGLAGPSATVHAACASATQAIGEAFETIRSGEADVVLTGGADSMMSMFCVAGFTLLGALSRHPEPARASRPFDLRRDGFVLGEGAGLVVLEELQHALRRGAAVVAEVAGYGSSLDAYRFTDVDPEGRGAAACMRAALASAGMRPQDVGYVNAHGTSTWQNDRVETRAIKAVFGDAVPRVAVSSTKSQLGHLLCAAGGVELALTALALRDQVLPPTVNREQADPECDLDYVPGTARSARVDAALSNSFGFGGQNGTLAVRRFERARGALRGRPRRRVVVTGLGVVSCLGVTLAEHWRRLVAGETGVRARGGAPAAGMPLELAAPVDAARVTERIRNRMLRKLLLPSGAFAVAAAGEALADAGLAGDETRLARCGLYFGSVTYELQGRTFAPALRASFGADGAFDFARFATVGMPLADPLLIVKGLPNAAPCGVSIEHGIRGPNASFSNGRTSGLHAAAAALAAVRHGVADVAVTGGSDSLLLADHAVAHHVAGRLLLHAEQPWSGARPFDLRRAGYVLGEGSAVCVLETLEHARARGARVYAEVLDAGGTTGRDDGGGVLAQAARAAQRDGPVADAVFADGQGTPDDDRREARAFAALGDGWRAVPATAATGALGETGAASGAFSLVHAVRGLADGVVPPTAGFARPDPDCAMPVSRAGSERTLRNVLVWSADADRAVALRLGAAP